MCVISHSRDILAEHIKLYGNRTYRDLGSFVHCCGRAAHCYSHHCGNCAEERKIHFREFASSILADLWTWSYSSSTSTGCLSLEKVIAILIFARKVYQLHLAMFSASVWFSIVAIIIAVIIVGMCVYAFARLRNSTNEGISVDYASGLPYVAPARHLLGAQCPYRKMHPRKRVGMHSLPLRAGP